MDTNPLRLRHDLSSRRDSQGFTLLELMIVVAILAILTRIAVSSYTSSVTKSRRAAAEACLSNFASYMERYFATNQSYLDTSGNVITLPSLDCATNQTIQYYTYSFNGTPTSTTYTLQAQPIGIQAAKDTQCAMLTLDYTGKQSISGGTGTTNSCWQR